jgi:hypothetical protein
LTDKYLWDGQEDSFAHELILIPRHLLNDFQEFHSEGLLNEVNIEKTFIVADSALDKQDVKLIADVVRKAPLSIDILNEYESFSNEFKFDLLYEKFRIEKNRTMLIANALKSFKELFFLLDEIKYKLFFEAPLNQESNWLNDSLSFTAHFEGTDSFNYLKRCVITKSLNVNISLLRQISNDFIDSKPFERLAILAGWFLFLGEQNKVHRDFTKAVMILHRSLETCFKYWLIESGEVNMDPNGETIGDKHTYLLDYLEMVKKERAVTDDEKETFIQINKLRNTCKYTHGYITISQDNFDDYYTKAKNYLLDDDRIRKYYAKFKKIFHLEPVHELLYQYLSSNHYIERYGDNVS